MALVVLISAAAATPAAWAGEWKTVESERVSGAPLYGLTNVLSTVDADQIREIEKVMASPLWNIYLAAHYPQYYDFPPYFDSERTSNHTLYEMAQVYYYPYSGGLLGDDVEIIAATTSHGEVRGMPYQQVNDFMQRYFGRVIDFTPYEVEELPTPTGFDDLIEFYAWNGYLCKKIAYSSFSSLTASIKSLANVGGDVYLAEVSVVEEDFDYTYDYGTVMAVLKRFDDHLQILKIYPFEETPELGEVQRFVVNERPESNFTVDYSALAGESEVSVYVEVLKNTLGEIDSLTDAGRSAVVSYIEYAVQNCSTKAVRAANNQVTISADVLSRVEDSAVEAMSELMGALGDVELQREPRMNVRIDAGGLDMKSSLEVRIDEDAVSALQEIDDVVIMLEDNRHGLTASAEDLRAMNGLYVRIDSPEENEYRVEFMDRNGEKLSRLDTSVTITLPATGEYSTVYAMIGDKTENWGGQYDGLNRTITFRTSTGGAYTVLEESTTIEDIGMLNEEQQDAIRFMVAKGIFEVNENGKFSPGTEMNRYQFARALVKIFFALDHEAKSGFADVEESSPYYPYVASGQQESIIKGYDDNTYRGENNTLRWHMIAFCARTLATKKGYTNPEDPSLYLNFADNQLLYDTCNDEDTASVALAVREGLIADGGALRPDLPVTKTEAAVMLYRLYMLLYQVSPAEIVITEAEEEQPAAEEELPAEEDIQTEEISPEEEEESDGRSNVKVVIMAVAAGTAAVTVLAVVGVILVRKKSR